MVRVLNSRNAAVGVDISVGLLLEAVKLDPGCLVRQLELLKDDENLGGVGHLVFRGLATALPSSQVEKLVVLTPPVQLDRLETHCKDFFFGKSE